ncbi:MAG: M15 family metallopeptidase [Burkholderiales bacterium]|jgi:LAS superfamily LD-carboxypeptidase LdcB|nr:M15 family metallopeptidase [Burkholderiales bacterium]
MFDPLQLTGRSRDHVVSIDPPRAVVHRDTAAALRAMHAAARADGFELRVASGFRDFDRQAAIWNAKWRGERVLLDPVGVPLDAAALSPHQRVDAILDWSALPGASRHHWGSEVDLFDAAALPEGAVPDLVPAEFTAGGPFAPLFAWLVEHAATFGFFRPYATDRGGVRPEPWHWSHAPVAAQALAALDATLLADALRAAPIDGLEHVLPRLSALHARYVLAVDAPPAAVVVA